MHSVHLQYTLSRLARSDRVAHPLMDLLQAVAEHGSISAAARALGKPVLVDPKGSHAFAQSVNKNVLQSHCFNVMYHEIFNDPEKALVLAKLLAWLDSRYAA